MKHKIAISTAIILLMLPCILSAAGNESEWTATLSATGEKLGGVDTYHVQIGVGFEFSSMEGPPAPPEYSTKMDIENRDGILNSVVIEKAGEPIYSWTIAIDPRGNIQPPGIRATTVSWNPAEFGEGAIELRGGMNRFGRVLVTDMKEVNQYVISAAGVQYVTIVYHP